MRARLHALARRAFAMLRILAVRGPVGVFRYISLELGGHPFVNVFAQGLAAGVDPTAARQWHLGYGKRVVIALLGTRSGLDDWMRQVLKTVDAHFLVSPELAATLEVNPAEYTIYDGLGELAETSFYDLKDAVLQGHRGADLLIVDLSHPLVPASDVLLLQHATHSYEGANEVGFVTPGLRDGKNVIAGYEWDRSRREWVTHQNPVVDHGHRNIPRYVLAANAHGMYIRSTSLDRVRFGSQDAVGLDFEQQLGNYLAQAWHQNIRTLAYPPVTIPAAGMVRPEATESDVKWLHDRNVTDAEGRRRIIYVLPATTISGGIRTVFEQADGLVELGFAVEIWSLQGQPDWIHLDIEVKTFANYFDMLVSLRDEEAIKVATWWETAQVVWLASVNMGIPVYYVQEFETWFYPDNPVARAAVAASYRSDFELLTIATYQQGELRDIGLDSTYIPSCYHGDKFGILPEVTRSESNMMAVGRSFFQKNFAMTAEAWSSLGDARPPLTLFGFEPEILVDERVTYEVRPSDARVNELYNEASFFVQTSIHEGFSLPLIEAMAAGCPVITTDSHGNRDFCHDGENCLMVEQGDVEGLAAAIALLDSDAELRARLSQAGLVTAQQHESAVIFARVAEYYNRVA